MTVLLQTRGPREVALRLKSVARTKGKSTYQVLRELAADYADQSAGSRFVSEGYADCFGLPAAPGFKAELSGPRHKYGDVIDEEFSVQARREEGAYPRRSVTDEQRSLRRKGPSSTSLYLRLGLLRRRIRQRYEKHH